MPNPSDYDNMDDFMGACVPMRVQEGDEQDQAVAVCMSMWSEKMSAKYKQPAFWSAVKAVGDWELDINLLPFSKDEDGQWADPKTEIMAEKFQMPLIVHSHGFTPDGKNIEEKPVLLGDPVQGSLRKESDGWHINVILNKAIKQAEEIIKAARRGLVAVSSGSIAHLARLDIGGKLRMYSKRTPGRIAIWPVAEISLWVKKEGNLQPANKYAYALPAMKAMYRDAGIKFPDVSNIDGVSPEAKQAADRARIEASKVLIARHIKTINKLIGE